MFEHLPHEKYLKTLLKNGGEYADLFYEETQTTHIVCEDKKIESVVSGVDRGAGLRLIADLKTAYGATNDLSPRSLNGLARSLTGLVPGSRHKKNFGIQKISPRTSFPVKKNPQDISLEEKIALVRKAEKRAWQLDRRIVQVRIRYSETKRYTEIADSDGRFVKNPTLLIVFSVSATASDGREYIKGYESAGGHLGYELFDQEDVEKVAQKAVYRALQNLKAKRAAGGTMPVVISSEAGGTFVHEAVGHGLEADLACQGLSVYKEKMGEKIASHLVTIVDDPTLPQKRGSFSFDDEGVPSEKALLVENGVLKNFMFDRLTAMKMGEKSNGHGRRESYKCKPIVRMTNTMMLPGRNDPEKIVGSVDRGLFVKMMGGGEVNTVNGDFVFEVAEGYQIESGKIGEPVRGATLTGNGPDVLKVIDKVGSDLGFSIGTCGKDGQEAPVSDAMPTVRIPEMVVGGMVD